MKVTRILLVAVVCILGSFSITQAQGDRPEHELHSMMIYNFLKYIQWPGDLNSGDFTIGVLGDDDVFNTLTKWYGGKVRGDKKFTIKKFNSPDDITDCQLIYVGKSASSKFSSVLSKIENTSTLTVTRKKGLGAQGSCINFRIIDNRLKFELNQSAIEKSKLKTARQLTSMAILI